MKSHKSQFIIILIGLFLVVSCNHEEIQSSSGEDLRNQIGYWHNKALESVFNNNEWAETLSTHLLSYSEIRNIIMRDLSMNDPHLFNYQSMQSDLAWSDEILLKNRIISNPFPANLRQMGGEPPVNYAALFKYLREVDEIGNVLYHTLIDLNNKVINEEVSRDEILILSRRMKDLPLSEKEKSYVEVFNQVLYASKNYWENSHARTLDKRTLGIIWADAAGGLYGMLCGPICSIIEAAAFSTIVAIQE